MKSIKAGIAGKISAFICVIVFLFLFGGTVSFASDATVYVAGNPDLYPIEYYDSSSGEYLGLMNDIYALLSEKTGYDFCYINSGTVNGQQRMAKNCQADVISAYVQGDIAEQYIKNSQRICSIQVDGEEKDVNIAFSEIASDKLISDVSQALNEISADNKLSLISSHTAKTGSNGNYLLWIYILAGIILLLLTIGFIIIVCIVRKRRSSQKNTMIDSRYGIGNDRYYIYCFDNLISDKSKSLYYITYIAFDEESINQQYGSVESKNIQRYVSEFLNNKTGAVEYLALVDEGIFAFLYQASNKADAEKRIDDIMNELESYLCNFKSEYSGLFHAGVCVLEENMGCTAEAAFYNAKQGYLYAIGNKTKYAFSTKNIVEETRQNERLHQHIMQAIKGGEFKIYLQYIVDRNGNLSGAEAVSRWQHPQEGLLSPSKYIKMMNQSDAVTMHDFYIFSQACSQLEQWDKQGFRDLFISCNFTRYSVSATDFAAQIEKISADYTIKRDKLIIEITEDSLSYNMQALKNNIEKCKKLGFLIALDDIGSGYTSLSDLYNYSIDFVKVERDIVLNAMEERGKMLLDGLVSLAHSMNIKALCEGIETKEQNDIILSTGCDYIQGYYYSHVLPQREAEKFLNNHYHKNDMKSI